MFFSSFKVWLDGLEVICLPNKFSLLFKHAANLASRFKNAICSNLKIAYHTTYNMCYITGVQTIRFKRKLTKRVVRILVPVGRSCFKLLDFVLLKNIRAFVCGIKSEAQRFVQGFSIAKQRVNEGFKQSPSNGLKNVLLLPFWGIRRHRRAIFSVFNIAAPVAAVFVLVYTIQFWSSMTFALSVEYDGHKLGYISDEAVYDNAATMATDRVINTDKSFKVQRIPKMTIAVVSKSQILDESEVCDKILESSNDSITEGSGLYIDGKFEGAVQSSEEIENMLGALLDSYCGSGKKERAEFIQDVKIVDGLYPVSSVVSVSDIHKQLTRQTVVDKYYNIAKGDSPLSIASKTDMPLDKLRNLNPGFDNNIFPDVKVLIQKAQPYLRVKVIKNVEYDKSIDYKTNTIKDNRQYIGYSSVRTKGVEGKQHIEAEVTYVDGIEQSRKILETKVIKPAVDKVVVVGAKKINPAVSAAGDGISTGRFVWPLPSCRMISSPYGPRWGRMHNGVDISGNGVYGKPIVSADGGRVVEVNHGYGGGYGNYIIVDHGGGYRTVYAHLSSISVRTGQKVSQGQQIGRAGNSGNSYGAHLHFEIRINGRAVNPIQYLR